MPRRKRVSKRRRESSLREILDEVLPPNPLVRRGPDDVEDESTDDVGFDDGVAFDETTGRRKCGQHELALSCHIWHTARYGTPSRIPSR